MTCDVARQALRVGVDDEWPRAVSAHLSGCEACLAVAIEQALRQAPSITVPATFAGRVAAQVPRDHAVLERLRYPGLTVAIAAVIVYAIAGAWYAAGRGSLAPDFAMPPAWPLAALLLAIAEALLIMSWLAPPVGTSVLVRQE